MGKLINYCVTWNVGRRYNREETLDIIRGRTARNMVKRREQNERQYNMCSRVINFTEVQEVFRRYFRQSNFERGYNAKLSHPLIKSRIPRKTGTCYYEEDLNGRSVGIYHVALILSVQSDFIVCYKRDQFWDSVRSPNLILAEGLFVAGQILLFHTLYFLGIIYINIYKYIFTIHRSWTWVSRFLVGYSTLRPIVMGKFGLSNYTAGPDSML